MSDPQEAATPQQEWGFESPQSGLMYVTCNRLLFETMLAGAPEGTVPYTRFAGGWYPAPTEVEHPTGVCPHEDCPFPVVDGNNDCGNHEEWMT